MGARDALSKQQGPLLAGAPIRSAGIEAACGAGDEPASGGVASRERSRVASRSGRPWKSRVDGVKDNRGRLLHSVQIRTISKGYGAAIAGFANCVSESAIMLRIAWRPASYVLCILIFQSATPDA